MADWTEELEGPGRNAAAALIDLFASYGLDTLAPKIVEFVQQGFSSDTITIMLQETPEYEKRFAANQKRVANGLPTLPPADYLKVESGYRQALQAAGMPPGFYDTHTDFQKWIEQDVSPNEISDRANSARRVADTVDPLQREGLARMGISADDLAAYYLDQNKALPLLQKQVDIALLASERERAGIGFDEDVGRSLFQQGVTVEQARQGYSQIADALPDLERLGEIEEDEFTAAELEAEVFGGDAEAARTRRGLASRERARFSESSGTSPETLRQQRQFQ